MQKVNKLKIAVLLHGHLRNFEECADYLNNNLLSHYDCDVFIHTWDALDHNSETWHEQRIEASVVDKKLEEIITTKYHPKGLIIEHQEKYPFEKSITGLRYVPELRFSSAIPYFMFYSTEKANKLRLEYEKQEGISYDYIVVTRPDVRLKRYFNIGYYLNEANIIGLDKDVCRFFGSFEDLSIGGITLCRSNDLFFFAKPNVIDKYIEINKVLTDEEIKKYGLTMVSMYTAKEIHAGILPIPLTYSMPKDWDYGETHSVESRTNRPYSRLKKTIYKIGSTLLYPIFLLQKKYRYLNYYEYKKRF